MRIRNMGVVAVFAAAALYAGASIQQAEAACKTAACAKQASVASKSRAVAPGKRTRHVTARNGLKTAHVKHGGRIADTTSQRKPLPASIANAHAELATPDSRSANDMDKNIAAVDENDVVTMNGVQIAASTQLNDMDRAVADQPVQLKADEQKPDIVVTQTEPPAPVPTGRIVRATPSGERHVLTNADTETWSKTSLIGKMFVAFGSLLTLASAARLMLA